MPLYATCLMILAPFACAKSEDDLRPAQRAAGGLMPDTDPKFEAEYVADQSQVKTIAPRTISYEPLDTFRSKAEPAAKAEAPAEAEPSKPTARAAPGPRGTLSATPPGGGGNFWSRVGMKALMGGGAAPPAPRPPGPGQPPPKGDEPAANDEASNDKDAAQEEAGADDEDSAEEEAASDEEEPAEDDETESDEEESKDKGSEEEPKEDSSDKEPKDTDNRD